MLENLYNILVKLLGESKQGGYASDILQYQFNCIKCAEKNGGVDNKFNLEVSFKNCLFSKGGLFHCWKCNNEDDKMKGGILSLIKNYGTPTMYTEYKSELDNLRKIKSYDINAFIDITEDPQISELMLPKSFKAITLENCPNKKAVNYLKSRGITQDIIDKFNIGYTDYSDDDYYWRNKIIVPSYDAFGDLNYYVGRDFSGKAKAKYKNCDADKKQIIYQESLIDWDSPIILVEGVFDSLVFPNTISMLGKCLTKDSHLYNTLKEKANAEIIICLDSDTNIGETKQIYKILDTGKLKNKIKYIRLQQHKDLSEIYEIEGKKGIINTIRKAKSFTKLELIFNE